MITIIIACRTLSSDVHFVHDGIFCNLGIVVAYDDYFFQYLTISSFY